MSNKISVQQQLLTIATLALCAAPACSGNDDATTDGSTGGAASTGGDAGETSPSTTVTPTTDPTTGPAETGVAETGTDATGIVGETSGTGDDTTGDGTTGHVSRGDTETASTGEPAPSCEDAVQNQDESDVDCGGGVCPTCGHCQACRGNVDCVAGSFCTKGKCVASAMVQISLLKHCGPAMANWTVGPPLPPGNYRITAEAGGGRVAKASGFGWRAACDGLDFGAMFVPFKEPSADAAFAALPVTQVDSPYPGGVLRCGIIDTICSDNLGGADFSVHLLCE